jgi:hypothetical protein
MSNVPALPAVVLYQDIRNVLLTVKTQARRIPKYYGTVLFLTKDQSRLRLVNYDGSLGEAVDWDDLLPVQEWLRETKPAI